MMNVYTRRLGRLLLSFLGVKHLPPANFFRNSIFKKSIYPRYVRLELTHRCNLQCVMCPSFLHIPQAEKKELTLKEIRKTIDELGGFQQKPYISVSGGEPFLRQDIFDILQYLEFRKLKYKVLTNATTLFPGVRERVLSIHPDIFQVSLDGPEDIHDAIRKTPGAFAKTTNAIRFIKDNSRLKILLMCVISSINANYLIDTVMVAQDLGVDLCFGHLSFFGLNSFMQQKMIMKEVFGLDMQDSRSGDINKQHELDVRLLFEQIAKIKEMKTKINVHFTQRLSKEQMIAHYCDSACCVSDDKCYYPWYGVRIDPYGEVSVCKDEYLPVGSTLEDPIGMIYNNRKANEFRQYIRKRLFPLCVRCCWRGSGNLMTTVFSQHRNLS